MQCRLYLLQVPWRRAQKREKSNTNPSAKAGQALVRSGVAAVKDSRYPGGEGGQTPTGEGTPQERRAAGMPEEREARRQQEREHQQERRAAGTYARGEGGQAPTGEGAPTREKGSSYSL